MYTKTDWFLPCTTSVIHYSSAWNQRFGYAH
jgi:hypothetical protein